MEYTKRKVEPQKALFFDLLQIADKFQGEDIINNSVLLFFENGQEIISNGEQKKAYHQVVVFLENNEIIKIYSDENLSCREKTMLLATME
jgi:hypothetical protein